MIQGYRISVGEHAVDRSTRVDPLELGYDLFEGYFQSPRGDFVCKRPLLPRAKSSTLSTRVETRATLCSIRDRTSRPPVIDASSKLSGAARDCGDWILDVVRQHRNELVAKFRRLLLFRKLLLDVRDLPARICGTTSIAATSSRSF